MRAFAGADFAGHYTGDRFSADIKPAADGYTGTLSTSSGASGNSYPLKAHEENGRLKGVFTSEGTEFEFNATLAGDRLSLSSGGSTYTMTRPTAAVNPLGGGNPLGEKPAGGNPLATPDAPANGNENRNGAADAAAINKQANAYLNGRGVEKDYARALALFHNAADAGNTAAMANIGYMYESGLGVQQDYGEAMQWYRKSADHGNLMAMQSVGYLLDKGRGMPKDPQQAMQWYQKSAAGGFAPSMNDIGMMYYRGDGVEADDSQALKWFRKAADAGNPDGQFNAGYFTETGRGTAADLVEATKLYRKAADSGDPNGMYRLGLMFEAGKGGVAVDPSRAAGLFKSAAAAGSAEAKKKLEGGGETLVDDAPANHRSAPSGGVDQSKMFEVKPGDTLVIDTGTGDVTVTAWDKPQVQVSSKALITPSNDGNRAFLKDYRTEITQSGGEVKLHAWMPADANGNVTINTSGTPVSYQINVPVKGVGIAIKGGMGDVTIVGTRASIKVDNQMGKITLKLPADLAAKIDAAGDSVNSEFKVTGSKDEKGIHGLINGGGPAIEVKSQMGEVLIAKQ